MSATAIHPEQAQPTEEVNYLNVSNTVGSWLLTKDHKRIAILYLVSVVVMFALGSFFAGLIRLELTSPKGQVLTNEMYNKVFTAHGVVMIFFFLLPAIPGALANFVLPMMIGARDLAFPRLNLLSWYFYIAGALLGLTAVLLGGIDTGWTFYTPYASIYSNSQVSIAIVGAFLAGFSSIFTGINFIATVHKMRAPGLTWFRLPLFIWSHYATSIIIILGTPVVAITLLLVLVERIAHIGVFSPELGGDPILFQHLFWFYSHPAVYVMLLPGMGVISEIIACFSRNRVFGYGFVGMSSMAIAALGFLVWGHHMFVSSQSMYQGIVFSLITYLVAIPSAIKVFNWCLTMYKGSVILRTPMIYALTFLALFMIGGLTGLYLSNVATDVHVTHTYFVVAHFHYVMVGSTTTAFLAGVHYWWPKMTGRMYPETWGNVSAILTLIGFNLTFFPQFIVGYMGMPRRYHYYYFAPEFQIYHILSSGGSVVLAIAVTLPVIYLSWSIKKGPKAPPNPWGATGLEWQTASPPHPHNFHKTPVVTEEAYNYSAEAEEAGTWNVDEGRSKVL